MIHTLIVLLVALTPPYAPKATYTIEFASHAQCIAAKEWILAASPKGLKAECFPSWT